MLQEFYGDGLIYEATASMMFHVPKDDIKKGGPRADLRSKGKVATLACGYQGSTGALIQMGALKSGIPEDELPGIVRRWRKANQNIVRFWYEVEEAAIGAVQGRRPPWITAFTSSARLGICSSPCPPGGDWPTTGRS